MYLVTGQERFRSTLSTSYYKGAHAVILVYSTTDRESFRNVQEFWLNQVHIQYGNDATDKLPVLLVGTKSDLLKKYDEQQEHVKKELVPLQFCVHSDRWCLCATTVFVCCRCVYLKAYQLCPKAVAGMACLHLYTSL